MKTNYIKPKYKEVSLISDIELLDSSFSGNLNPGEGDGEEDLAHQLFSDSNTDWGKLW